jgi:hypothetical protein
MLSQLLKPGMGHLLGDLFVTTVPASLGSQSEFVIGFVSTFAAFALPDAFDRV